LYDYLCVNDLIQNNRLTGEGGVS